MSMRRIAITIVASVVPVSLFAQSPREVVTADVLQNASTYEEMAMQIWDLSEVGYQEHENSALLRRQLESEGFEVAAGIAGLPTAFVASHRSVEPVIGILAEFDALPGLGQDRVPELHPIEGKGAEFEERRGNGSYIPFVGDREPPLDYRSSTRN